MRVTESSISYNYLSDINQTRGKIVDLQAQMASGKRVLKPSDDPSATNAILRLKASMQANDQYAKNVQEASGMAQATTNALDSFASLMMDLKDLLTKAANVSSGEALPTLAAQVDQILSESVAIANTNFNGKYLFGGTQTTVAPFTLAADRSSVAENPAGIDGAINFSVSEGLTQQVNISGEEAFQGTAIFGLMIQIRDQLSSGNQPTTAQIDAVDQAFDHVTLESGKAGSFVQNLDTLSAHLDSQKTQLSLFLSNEQDADIAESIMQLKQQQAMLDAALNTGAQVLPKTLVDYLRTA